MNIWKGVNCHATVFTSACFVTAMATYVTLPMDMKSNPFMHFYSVVHQVKTMAPDLDMENLC